MFKNCPYLKKQKSIILISVLKYFCNFYGFFGEETSEVRPVVRRVGVKYIEGEDCISFQEYILANFNTDS